MTKKTSETPVRPKVQECIVCGFGEDGSVVDEVAYSRSKVCPKKPTQAEVDEHEKTHLPFRNWCEICISGRSKDDKHEEREIAENLKEVHLDYCFLRNGRGQEYAPVLASKDRRSKLLCAHVVPNKGASAEWVISQSMRDIVKMGHSSSVVLRSDGEPALVDLLGQVALQRQGVTVIEHAVKDSKSNGFIERGIQSLEEMVRVYKLDIEKRIGMQVKVSSNVFAWMVEYAADMINKKIIGEDGKTAYERLKLKKHHGEFVKFGAKVMYRVQGKVEGGVVTERWFEGIWLGKRFHTEEHIVANLLSGKVVRTRAIRQLPKVVTAAELDNIVGRPWAPNGILMIRNTSPEQF